MNSFYYDESELSLNEFDEPSVMTELYMPQISSTEFEDQSATETEQALKELINYMENNTDTYARILKRRKIDEKKKQSVMSLLKVQFMMKVKGSEYVNNIVTEEEVYERLDQVKMGMMMAYNYAQESKGRRFSRRLALKKSRDIQLRNSSNHDNAENHPTSCAGPQSGASASVSKAVQPVGPPPAPPGPPPAILPECPIGAESNPLCDVAMSSESEVPQAMEQSETQIAASSVPPAEVAGLLECSSENVPPIAAPAPPSAAGTVGSSMAPPPPMTIHVLTPLKDNQNIMTSTPCVSSKESYFKTPSSVTSLASIHNELVKMNPLKRLRTTQMSRSPGGTPITSLARPPIRASLLDTPNPHNKSESLTSAFFRIMDSKFRNVRTPSPSNLTFNSLSDFSP